jgi:hypothetical protein
MEIKMNTYKRGLGVNWVKGESGNTYLCPIGALKGIDNPTEEQLRSLCVDESMDPQNS